MRPTPPLRKHEGARLEFKGRDALHDLLSIGREVVAMLNAEGGEVWIGLGEEEGVAVRLEPIEQAEHERRRLLDYLLDTVEPPPTDAEVRVEVVRGRRTAGQVPGAIPGEVPGEILVVRPEPARWRQPYALASRGGRLFVTRVADRLRPLSREEIASLFADRAGGGGLREPTPIEAASARLAESIDRLRRERDSTLGLILEPTEDLAIDLAAVLRGRLLVDPEATGNRRAGYSFAASMLGPSGSGPRLEKGELTVGHPESFLTRIASSGRIVFSAPLVAIGRPNPPELGGRALLPLQLFEFPTSVFRLGAALYGDQGPRQSAPAGTTGFEVVVGLAIFGLRGWKLAPGLPGRWDGQLSHLRSEPAAFPDRDLLLERPLIFPADLAIAAPDRCAWRLLRLVYAAFGLGEAQMPPWLDDASGRLVVPE